MFINNITGKPVRDPDYLITAMTYGAHYADVRDMSLRDTSPEGIAIKKAYQHEQNQLIKKLKLKKPKWRNNLV